MKKQHSELKNFIFPSNEIESGLEAAGSNNRYQIAIILIFLFVKVVTDSFYCPLPYFLMNPNIICSSNNLESEANDYSLSCNLNKVCLINQMIETSRKPKFDATEIDYYNSNLNNINTVKNMENQEGKNLNKLNWEKNDIKKINFILDKNKEKSTFINYFDIYCNTIKIGLIGSSASIGNLISNIISPFFTDHFGRIKTIQIILIFDILIKTMIFYIKDFTNLLILLTLINITNNLIYFAACLYINEMVSSSHRGVYSCYFNAFFGISGISYTLIFYFTFDWFYLNLFSIICSLISFILIQIYLYESLRFYKIKSNNFEILETLHLIALFNNKEEEFLSWRKNFCVNYRLDELLHLKENVVKEIDYVKEEENIIKNINLNYLEHTQTNQTQEVKKNDFAYYKEHTLTKNNRSSLHKDLYNYSTFKDFSLIKKSNSYNSYYINNDKNHLNLDNEFHNFEIESFIYDLNPQDKYNTSIKNKKELKNKKSISKIPYNENFYGTFEDNSILNLKEDQSNSRLKCENNSNNKIIASNFFSCANGISKNCYSKLTNSIHNSNINQKHVTTISPTNISIIAISDIWDLQLCKTFANADIKELKLAESTTISIKNTTCGKNSLNKYRKKTEHIEKPTSLQIIAIFSNENQLKTFLIFSYISFVTISGIMYNAIDMKESPDSIYYPLVLYFTEFIIISLIGYLIDLPYFGRKIPCIFFSFLAGFFYLSKFLLEINYNVNPLSNLTGHPFDFTKFYKYNQDSNGMSSSKTINFNNTNSSYSNAADYSNKHLNNHNVINENHLSDQYSKYIYTNKTFSNNSNSNQKISNINYQLFDKSKNYYIKNIETYNNYHDFSSEFYQSKPIDNPSFNNFFPQEKVNNKDSISAHMFNQHKDSINSIIKDILNEKPLDKGNNSYHNETSKKNFLLDEKYLESSFLMLIINYFVRFSVSISFNILIEYNFEVYSTDIRSIAFNINKLFSRFGDFFTPLLMSNYYNYTTFILGILYLIMAFLINFLRETRGESLKDDFNENYDEQKISENKCNMKVVKNFKE